MPVAHQVADLSMAMSLTISNVVEKSDVNDYVILYFYNRNTMRN